MNDIVRAGSEEVALLGLPTFEQFEGFASMLAELRQSAAEAREPTIELLAKLDEALALVAASAGNLKAASAMAGKVEVANYLALLGKSYLNSKAQDVRIFAQVMLGDIVSLQPSLGAVEIACRRWRQRSRFMPEIAELFAEVRSAKDMVQNAIEFADRLPAMRDRMSRELEQS